MAKRIPLTLFMLAFAMVFGCAPKHTETSAANTAEPASASPTEEATEQPEDELVVIDTPAPTEVPTEEPTEEPTAEPTATPLVISMYKSRVNKLKILSAPDADSEVVAKVGFEDNVQVVGMDDSEYAMLLYNDEVCYCKASNIVPADEKLYGYLPFRSENKKDSKGNVVYEEDGVTPVKLTAELIDVRLVVPNIEIYQIFGTDKNFTGRVLYDRPVPVMQKATAQKLAVAARKFAEDGYTIKLYDCYRPKSVQFILYDIVQNSAYIANPYNSASNHNRAAAIDMTLIGPDGVELDFPTPMHTFTKKVYRASSDSWTEEQRKNVDYMTSVMLDSGFKLINTEWWHFSDTDYESFMVLDIDMKDIPMNTASHLGY